MAKTLNAKGAKSVKKAMPRRAARPALANAAKHVASTLAPDWAREMRMRMRLNPIRGLDFEALARQIDAFAAGWLGEFAMTAEAIETRDDTLKSAAPKRKKAAARNGYEILRVEGDDSTEAKAHEEALRFFYANLTATNALDENERGGIKLLLRQMMDAVGKKYAAHEIVWRTVQASGVETTDNAENADSGARGATRPAVQYTADFRFVPLQFFENTTGRLRFLPTGFGIEGEPLDAGGWMVTCGDGVMIACAIAWMFKHLPLKDWVVYTNRHGMPGIKGMTPAARGTPEWEAMEEAVKQFASEYAVVMSNGEAIEALDVKGQGELPYPPLVDRMDRALARLWRGGDLGTMSKDSSAVGSNPQENETEILEQDDAEMLTEALQQQVDKYVIAYTFGPGTTPRAYIQVTARNRQNVKTDLEVDQFLLNAGAPLAVVETMERYNRQMPASGEPTLQPIAPLSAPSTNEGKVTAANERLAGLLFGGARGAARPTFANEAGDQATLLLIENARPLLAQAEAAELAPLAQRIEDVLRIENEAHLLQAVRALRADLPLLTRQIARNPKAAKVYYEVFGAALLNGYAGAAADRKLAGTLALPGKEITT